MRASLRRILKTESVTIEKGTIGVILAVCWGEKYGDDFIYIIEFPKIGTFSVPLTQLDIF